MPNHQAITKLTVSIVSSQEESCNQAVRQLSPSYAVATFNNLAVALPNLSQSHFLVIEQEPSSIDSQLFKNLEKLLLNHQKLKAIVVWQRVDGQLINLSVATIKLWKTWHLSNMLVLESNYWLRIIESARNLI